MTGNIRDLGLVKGAAKRRQQEDKARADAWSAARQAELEAIVNRTYDGRDIPECAAIIAQAAAVVAPLSAAFDAAFAAVYPAAFQRARLGVFVQPGGIPEPFRKQVRRDAAVHIAARKAYMVANSANTIGTVLARAEQRATDDEATLEDLKVLAAPNEATPVIEPPGPALGALRPLLPNPDESQFDGYRQGRSALLPRPEPAPQLTGPDSGDEAAE